MVVQCRLQKNYSDQILLEFVTQIGKKWTPIINTKTGAVRLIDMDCQYEPDYMDKMVFEVANTKYVTCHWTIDDYLESKNSNRALSCKNGILKQQTHID